MRLTRSAERLARRLAYAASALLFAASAVVAGLAWRTSQEPVASPGKPGTETPAGAVPRATASDPGIENLASTQMTRTIVKKVEAPVQPQAPALSTLIRVKGIMDFGDPKDNEAIIEVLRSGRTHSCKAGERVDGVEATIKRIDSGVVFTYDSQEVRLEVWRGEQGNALPMASPERQVRTAGNEMEEIP